MNARATVLLISVLALAGCTNYATISETRPVFHPAPTSVGRVQTAQKDIADASLRVQREPLAALGEYLAAAQSAARELQHDPHNTAARDAYNFALARVFSTIKEANLAPWSKPLRVPSAGGDFILTHKPDPRPQWNPALYEFTPADQMDIRGSYVGERTTKAGIGAPLVAVGRQPNERAVQDFSVPRAIYGITGVIRFSGTHAEVNFLDPLSTERVQFAGHSFPLAADYTAPLAVMMVNFNPAKYERARLLRPEAYVNTTRTARLQPYDPNKTVVLFIHGLMDSAATWMPMLNELRGNEQIRRHYQFWFYSYPSGYPYPYSASILRHDLDAIEKRYPLQRKMVVVGHSMGGCISQLLITDPGDKIWLETFHKPPAQVPMPAESKKILTESIIFRHRPEVGRVIFISSPLRGSEFASGWIGRLGTSFIKSPGKLLSAGNEALKFATLQTGDLRLKRIPDSVDTLAPNNHFVRAINTFPMTPGIPYHVISGDRGLGGNKDHTKPVMSDGIVPYWSSHLDGAVSELVVPSHHSAHQNPQGIAEVKRILIKYCESESTP